MRMDVWMEGSDTPLGWLVRAGDKSLSFAYSPDAAPGQRLSLSLPVTAEPHGDAACRGYFANLIFEGEQRDQVLDRFGLDRDDIGMLLWHLGADCPGAISVTPEGTGPGKMPGRFPTDYEALSEDRLHRIILSLHLQRRVPEAERDPSPIAGVQGKIACLALEGAIWLPRLGSRAPTTHILKVSPHSDPVMTRHEAALLQIASRIGIKAAETEARLFEIEGRLIHALISTRFDRHVELSAGRGTIHRHHVEDFCQALGLPPRLKYERDAEQPGRCFSAAAVNRIAEETTAPALLRRDFLAQTIFNLLVGNTDNHGKNAALLSRGQEVHLAPLYDVVPVFMDPNVTHEFAFRHGHARFAEDFDPEALRGLLADLGFGKPPVERVLKQIQRFARDIAEIAPRQAPKLLADGLHAQARVIEDALGTPFGLPQRDYFQRVGRDGASGRAGGWA
jgi:serine/threonine-protein kinase HipA